MVEQKYVDYWRSRQTKHQDQIKAWEQEAWAETAVALLRNQFGATQAPVYGFELDTERLDRLIERYSPTWKQFEQEIQRFVEWPRELAVELG